MTKQEFESRVNVIVSESEYCSIEQVYLNCEIDKDEFCAIWRKMNKNRVAKAIAKQKKSEKEALLRSKLFDIINKPAKQSGWNKRPSEVFTKKELKLIESVGIEINETTRFGYYHFVNVSDVVSDIRKYLKVS